MEPQSAVLMKAVVEFDGAAGTAGARRREDQNPWPSRDSSRNGRLGIGIRGAELQAPAAADTRRQQVQPLQAMAALESVSDTSQGMVSRAAGLA